MPVISANAIPLRFQIAEVGVDWLQCNIECQEGCPVNTNCRGYLMLAAEGRFQPSSKISGTWTFSLARQRGHEVHEEAAWAE